jgi:hypothetical protein
LFHDRVLACRRPGTVEVYIRCTALERRQLPCDKLRRARQDERDNLARPRAPLAQLGGAPFRGGLKDLVADRKSIADQCRRRWLLGRPGRYRLVDYF